MDAERRVPVERGSGVAAVRQELATSQALSEEGS